MQLWIPKINDFLALFSASFRFYCYRLFFINLSSPVPLIMSLDWSRQHSSDQFWMEEESNNVPETSFYVVNRKTGLTQEVDGDCCDFRYLWLGGGGGLDSVEPTDTKKGWLRWTRFVALPSVPLAVCLLLFSFLLFILRSAVQALHVGIFTSNPDLESCESASEHQRGNGGNVLRWLFCGLRHIKPSTQQL